MTLYPFLKIATTRGAGLMALAWVWAAAQGPQAWAGSILAESEFVRVEAAGEATGALKRSARKLLRFVEDTVGAQLPADALAEIHKHHVTIELCADDRLSGADGLFVDPQGGQELRILLKQTVLAAGDAQSVVAHEYFHAVHYVLHADEQAWLREGLAQEFEYLVLGRHNYAHLRAAMMGLSTRLEGAYPIEMSADGATVVRASDEQYGHDLLYVHYLLTQCGGTPLFWRIVRGEPGVYGGAGIGKVLASAGAAAAPCQSFDASAVSFEIARVHNHVGGAGEMTYLLLPSSFAGPEPLGDVQARAALPALGAYEPLVVTADAAVDAPLGADELAGTRVFWLQGEYPWAVLEQEPASRASGLTSPWRRLLIKR